MNEGCSLNQKMDSSNRLFFCGGEVRICFSCPVFLSLTLYLQKKKKSKRDSVLYLSTIALEMNEEKQKKKAPFFNVLMGSHDYHAASLYKCDRSKMND